MGIKVRKDGQWVTVAAGSDVPVGGIIMYTGSSAPSGWVFCDNSTAAVAAGAPDLRDKFIIGGNVYDASVGWETNVTGTGTQTGGMKDAVVVSHTHTVGAAFGTNDQGGTGLQKTLDYDNSTAIAVNTSGASGGSVGTNANLPPYFALAYIMRIS